MNFRNIDATYGFYIGMLICSDSQLILQNNKHNLHIRTLKQNLGITDCIYSRLLYNYMIKGSFVSKFVDIALEYKKYWWIW